MTETQSSDAQPQRRARKTIRPLPTYEEVMAKEYLVVEDLARLMSTTVEGIRTKLKLGSIPPGRRTGRRRLWRRDSFLAWLDGADSGDLWVPPRRPR